MPKHYPPIVKEKFYQLIGVQGWSVARAAQELGISQATGMNWKRELRENVDVQRKVAEAQWELQPPIPHDKLRPEFKKALNDIPLFAKLFFGITLKPVQVEMAKVILQGLNSPEEEYIVLNEPPGIGKSTILMITICLAICRDRSVRCLYGSATTRLAVGYTRAIRRRLEFTKPVDGAKHCLLEAYGRFKPENKDLWAADGFVVEQYDDAPLESKEPTLMAISRQMDFIGARANLVIWDDLVTQETVKTSDQQENIRRFWTQIAESRVQHGGCLILNGQRIGPDDLYQFALEMKVPPDGDDELLDDVDVDTEEWPAKYKHVIFPAHVEELCKGDKTHSKDMPAWPESCILDPKQLPYRKLMSIKRTDPYDYEITYQQKNIATHNALVQEVWLTGGYDPVSSGNVPGCYNYQRDLAEVPVDLSDKYVSLMCVDPSPSRFWAVQWWLYDAVGEKSYLMEAFKSPRQWPAPSFFDHVNDQYVGLGPQWVTRAKHLGVPVRHLIIESNAAQKFMGQMQSFQDWCRKEGISFIPHMTHQNKSDPDFGIQTIGTDFRLGRVDLPMKSQTAVASTMNLVTELRRYPIEPTDQVMAYWFKNWNIQHLQLAHIIKIRQARPSWMQHSQHNSRLVNNKRVFNL